MLGPLLPIGLTACQPVVDGLPTAGEKASPCLTLFDVGQGDAVGLWAGNPPVHPANAAGAEPRDQDLAFLIDAGPPATPWDSLSKTYHLKRVHRLFLTHGDADHIGGVFALLRAATVEKLYITSRTGFRGIPMGKALLDTMEALGIAVDTLTAGMAVSLGAPASTPMHIDVLWPQPGNLSAGNEASLVLRLSLGLDASPGRAAALFMGDAGLPVEAALVQTTAGGLSLAAAWLKVGHHGSRSASRAGFLHEVAPDWAAISCDSTVYGHPHAEVVQGLSRVVTPEYVVRTDRAGTVSWVWEKAGVWRRVEH